MSLLLLLRRRAAPSEPLVPLPDTAFARMSALHTMLPFPFMAPPPDGSVDAGDRAFLVNTYVPTE